MGQGFETKMRSGVNANTVQASTSGYGSLLRSGGSPSRPLQQPQLPQNIVPLRGNSPTAPITVMAQSNAALGASAALGRRHEDLLRMIPSRDPAIRNRPSP